MVIFVNNRVLSCLWICLRVQRLTFYEYVRSIGQIKNEANNDYTNEIETCKEQKDKYKKTILSKCKWNRNLPMNVEQLD